jgi:hypothetical protein
MAELSMARLFSRNASRFSRLFVRLHVNKDQTFNGATAFGDYLNSQMAVIQLPPGQVANALEIQDSTGNAAPAQGNVLFSIDPSGNFTQSGVPNNRVCVAQVTLTAANLIAMYTTPVSILPAPAAGIAIVVDAISFQMKPTATQFTGGGLVTLQYHGTAILPHGASDGVPATTVKSATGSFSQLSPVQAVIQPPTATGIDITNAGAAFATGTGTAVVTIWYTLVTQS